MGNNLFRIVLGLLFILIWPGCRDQKGTTAGSQAVNTNQQIFQVKGVIQELKPDGKTAVIKHEEIPNYMAAMTMPLRVRDAKELQGLKPGDTVTFRMVVTENEGWIEQVRKVGFAPNEMPSRESVNRVKQVEPLQLGDPVPNHRFTNELGEAVSLGQLKGKAVAITFIFTRCPFPDFCPRMSKNFTDAYEKMKASPQGPKNWKLLSLSFDPEFDTPKVLKGYAQRYKYDPEYWSFLTGGVAEIQAICEQFGLLFPRNGAGFDHNLRTVIIDSKGRVQRVFTGNTWTVDEFVAELVKAAAE